MKKTSLRRRRMLRDYGSVFAALLVVGALALMVMTGGTTGPQGATTTSTAYNAPAPGGPSQNASVDVNVDNVVQVIVNRICPVECPDLQQVLKNLFALTNRVELLEENQQALANDIMTVDRFAQAKIKDLQNQIIAVNDRNQRAIDGMMASIARIQTDTAAQIGELNRRQTLFQSATEAGFKAVQDQIRRVQQDANARIAQIENMIVAIERDNQRAQEALVQKIREVDQRNGMRISALETQIAQVKAEAHATINRISAVERQIPAINAEIGKLDQRLDNMDARMADIERALGYLLAKH
jgi:chromosome segregation ATPase